LAEKPKSPPRKKRRWLIPLFAVGLAFLLVFVAFYLITFWSPIQRFTARAAFKFFKIDAEVEFENLDFWLNSLRVEGLEFRFAKSAIVVSLDSLSADFSLRDKVVHRLDIYRPRVKVGEFPQTAPGKPSEGGGSKTPDVLVEKLNITEGVFSIDGFSIEDLSYIGAAGLVNNRVELTVDSIGAYLPGRGRLIRGAGELSFDQILEMDFDLTLARSTLKVRGAISSFDPFEWHFAGGGKNVDLVEVDSILGLGFLDGGGEVRIDLSGGDDFVEGEVFIDGEIFNIPAKKVSTRLVFRDQKLTLPNIRGSAWGAPVEARLELDFTKEESGGGIGLIIDGTTKNFNLNAFIPDGSLPTNLSGKTRIDGRIIGEAVELVIRGDLGAGSILEFPFDAVSGSLFVAEDSVRFYPGFEIVTAGNFITMLGVIVFESEIFIEFGLWARDVASIASWFGLEEIVGGRLRLENGMILGPIDNPVLSLDIMSDSLTTAIFEHDWLQGDLTIYNLFDGMRGNIYLMSEGAVGPLGYDSLLVNLEIHGNRYYVKPLRMWGDTLSIKGLAEIYADDDSVGIQVEGLEVSILGQPVVLESTFTVNIIGDEINSSPLLARAMHGGLLVENLKGNTDNFSFTAILDDLHFADLGKILGTKDIDGNISGSMFYASGDGGTGNFTLEVEDLITGGLPWQEAKAEGTLNGGVLSISPLVVSRPTERYLLTGNIDLSGEGTPFSFEARGKGSKIEALPAFVAEVDSAVGPFEVIVSVGGTSDSLFLEGGFNWKNGVLGLRDLADPVEQVFAELTLQGSSVSIDSLSGVIGAPPIGDKSLWERIKRIFTKKRLEYGEFAAKGSIDLSDPNNPKPDISLKAKSLPLNFPDDGIFARIGAGLHVGYGKKIEVSGNVNVESANIVQLEAAGGGSGGDIPVELNILVDLPRNININTTLLESEIGGKVNVLTEDNQLALYGDLEVLRGKVFFYGQTFRIEKGVLAFRSLKRINPTLDITAVSRVGQTRIVINVTGDLETPKVSLYAEDQNGSRLPYDQRQIVSILAFRTEDSEGTVEVGSLMEERLPQVVQSYISREFESVARTTLGVESFEFVPSDEDVFDFSQANVSIGKYLTDKIYLKYTRSLSFDENSEDIINLQYRITDVISIEAKRETGPQAKENYRLDLKFRWEY